MTSSEVVPGGWRLGPPLTTALTPTAVVPRSDGAGLVFGWAQDGGGGIATRRAILVSVDSSGVGSLVLDEPGWFVSGNALAGHVAAIRARPGPVFDLWRSADGGVTWLAPVPTPASSLTQVCRVSPDEVWALGADTLGRWRSETWQDIDSPAPVDAARDRLFAAEGLAVLATPAGLHVWREDRQAWAHRSVGGAHVRALCSPYVAAVDAVGTVRLGRLEQAWVEWLGEVQGGADVADLTWANWEAYGDSAAIQLLLVPRDPREHGGLVVVRSAPTGGLVTERLSVPADASWAGIYGARGVLALTVHRRPIQSGWDVAGP